MNTGSPQVLAASPPWGTQTERTSESVQVNRRDATQQQQNRFTGKPGAQKLCSKRSSRAILISADSGEDCRLLPNTKPRLLRRGGRG